MAAPFFVAAIWAVHPVSTEAVTNIIGRADLLAALGVLAALYAYIRMGEAAPGERTSWVLAVMAATTVGLLSKENAAAVVPVAMVYDMVFRRPSESMAALGRRWLVFVLPLLLFWMLRSKALTATALPIPFVDNPIVGAGFVRGRLTALAVIARYAALIIWPARLSPDYSYNQIPLASGSPGDWIAWCALALLLLAAAVAWRQRHRLAFFALVFFFVTLLPVANLLFPTGTIMGERLMYLPSIGLIAALVMLVASIAGRFRTPVLAVSMLGAAIVVLGARTWLRNPDWNTEVTLWSSAVQAAPRSFKTHGALAEALYEADPSHANLDRVIAEKEKSLDLLEGLDDPADVSGPYREAAAYYLEAGSYERAISAAQRFLSLAAPTGRVRAGDVSKTHLLLATAYARLGDSDKAREAAHVASAGDPFTADVYRVGAAALVDASLPDDAATTLMTGFIVTGNQELRSALINLYRGGLDPAGCALKNGPAGIVLDPSCAIVRRHLCDGAAAAVRLQRANGRGDLAEQVEQSTLRPLDCPGRAEPPSPATSPAHAGAR